jgi:hypothetical protein
MNSVAKVLVHRMGVKSLEDLDESVQRAFQIPFGASALRQFSLHEEWPLRAAALALANLSQDSLDDQALLVAVLANLEHDSERVRHETIPLIAHLSSRNPDLARATLLPELLRVATASIHLDEETRGMEVCFVSLLACERSCLRS